MEERILLWIQAHGHPVLDVVFRMSHELGTRQFCIGLVLAMVAISAVRENWREWILWLGLGLTTLLIELGLKPLFGRARPDLWEGPIHYTSLSMPSGHAVASATFFPLLAWTVGRWFPRIRKYAYVVAGVLVLYVGFGRLYLGVHWPTDVLVGWTLGLAQTWVAIRLTRRRKMPEPEAAT